MSLENMKGKMSRLEMKTIMAGGSTCNYNCQTTPNNCNGGCKCSGSGQWAYCH
jgi:hypothetical protein